MLFKINTPYTTVFFPYHDNESILIKYLSWCTLVDSCDHVNAQVTCTFFCSNISADDMLYTETDLEESMDKIETINFHEVREVAGIKFWCYHAGHVLGAAMFMIEIAGVKVQRNNKTTCPPPYSFCVFSPVLMRCFLSYTAAVHRRLLSTGGQTSDGS